MVTKPTVLTSLTKAETKSRQADSHPQPIPTLMRKALMRAGVLENEIPNFLSWAFEGRVPSTFHELCVIWNEKFGSQLWLNVQQLSSAQECSDFFFQMGKVFVDTRSNKRKSLPHMCTIV